MQIDVAQYLESLLEYLQGLPYYPYSVLGAGGIVLLLLLVLLAKRKASVSKRKAAAKRMPVRGVDLSALDGTKKPSAPSTGFSKPAVDPAVLEIAVKSCQEAFQGMYVEMYIGLGLMSDFEAMRTEVDRRIADGKETYHSISELKMTPEGVVLMQIASVSGNILQSGEQHVGKGILGIHGQELFGVYRYALTTMQEKGFATREETQSKMDFMGKKVQELG